jgi:hypothetical protein
MRVRTRTDGKARTPHDNAYSSRSRKSDTVPHRGPSAVVLRFTAMRFPTNVPSVIERSKQGLVWGLLVGAGACAAHLGSSEPRVAPTPPGPTARPSAPRSAPPSASVPLPDMAASGSAIPVLASPPSPEAPLPQYQGFEDNFDAMGCMAPDETADSGDEVAASSDATEAPGCQAVRKRYETLSESALSEGPRPRGVTVPVCRADAAGAVWAVLATWPAIPENTLVGTTLRGTWRLIRTQGSRSMASSATQPHRFLWGMFGEHAAPPRCLWLFDYDGDHAAEAITLSPESINNSWHERRIVVWKWDHKGGLVVYPRTPRGVVFNVVDVDADGRPDLLVNSYARQSETPFFVESWYPVHSSVEWGLLAHSQPDGSFSFDSPVARRYARELCPAPPASELPASPSEWAGHVHCARLWGQPGPEILARIRTACAAPAPDSEAESVCRHSMPFFEALTRSPLPFSLSS